MTGTVPGALPSGASAIARGACHHTVGFHRFRLAPARQTARINDADDNMVQESCTRSVRESPRQTGLPCRRICGTCRLPSPGAQPAGAGTRRDPAGGGPRSQPAEGPRARAPSPDARLQGWGARLRLGAETPPWRPRQRPPGAFSWGNQRPGAEAARTMRVRSREVQSRRRRRREERGRRRRREGGGEKEEETQEQETQERRGRRAAAAPAQRSRRSAGNPSPAALSPPSHAFRPYLGQ